jgi:hypothetical protein
MVMTVGLTAVSTARIIEHAFRRAGVGVEKQTPDTVQLARDNLFFLFASYSNRGLPLWCIEEVTLPIVASFKDYECPAGTVDVLSSNLRKPSLLSATDVITVTDITSSFTSASKPIMFGLVCDATYSLNLNIDYSQDGVTWTTLETVSITAGIAKKYVTLASSIEAAYYRVVEQTLLSVGFVSLEWIDSYVDRQLTRMSRDQYFLLPNKHSVGNPVQYWYDRQLEPKLVLWPVPNEGAILQIVRQRQIGDVGALTEQLDIPVRWIEATIWQLAKRIVLSLPGLDPQTKQIVIQMAAENQIETEAEDVDNAPVMLQPDISVYS